MSLLKYWHRRREQRYSIFRPRSVLRLVLLLGVVLFLMWFLDRFTAP
jgi:hypothetical protein